jgi:hypothetical protein
MRAPTDPICVCGDPRSEHDPDVGCVTQPGLCPCYEFRPRLSLVPDAEA